MVELRLNYGFVLYFAHKIIKYNLLQTCKIVHLDPQKYQQNLDYKRHKTTNQQQFHNAILFCQFSHGIYACPFSFHSSEPSIPLLGSNIMYLLQNYYYLVLNLGGITQVQFFGHNLESTTSILKP